MIEKSKLNLFTPNELNKVIPKKSIGFWIYGLWLYVYNIEHDLSFVEYRQLFLDLIRYYMDKGLMKFGNRDGTGETIAEWKYAQPCKDTHWLANKVENRNSDEVVAYLEKGFIKNEKEFEDTKENVENPNIMDQVTYFYCYCTAVAWFDSKDNEWIWSS